MISCFGPIHHIAYASLDDVQRNGTSVMSRKWLSFDCDITAKEIRFKKLINFNKTRLFE